MLILKITFDEPEPKLKFNNINIAIFAALLASSSRLVLTMFLMFFVQQCTKNAKMLYSQLSGYLVAGLHTMVHQTKLVYRYIEYIQFYV